MPSDLIRGWIPVRVKKTRQNKECERAGTNRIAMKVSTAFAVECYCETV
jgi:hypothetical protein